jgi:zinc transporter ZupT
VVPVVLLGVAVAFVISRADDIVDLIGSNPPPADEFDIRRVELLPGEIRITARNPQREELTIASVTVDDAIVPFTLDGPATLKRLRSSTIAVVYDWVEDEPLTVGVTSSTGIETVEELAAAVATPQPTARGFVGYGVIGLLVGVVPVALGLLWVPSLRRADPRWLAAFMAMTCGLLSFLAVEALSESLELQAALPASLGGAGLVLLGVAASALAMTYLSARLGGRGSGATGLALALLVSIGIGVHNFGEGLAIGTSFSTGALQLGTFFVVGFMVHNLTEGLGIAAPAASERPSPWRLFGLALVAGAPVVAGAWIGGYTSSDTLAVLFFALAAGAALQVVVEVGRWIAHRSGVALRSGWVIGGYLAGVAAMYLTGLLVA